MGIQNYDFFLKVTRFEGNFFFEMEECGGDKNWINVYKTKWFKIEVIKKCEHSICSPNQIFLMKIIFKKIDSCFDVEKWSWKSKYSYFCHLNSFLGKDHHNLIYRTRAIITRVLYTFGSLFEVQKRFFKELFFLKFWPYVWLVFKSGFQSRAGYSGAGTVPTQNFYSINKVMLLGKNETDERM